MNNSISYTNLSNFILRTPLFSYSFLDAIISNKDISEDELKQLCLNPIIQEAIFLASPDLFTEFKKWLTGELTADKDDKKAKKESNNLQLAVFKYILRMSTRCTPFGLFAGFSIGSFDSDTKIKFPVQSKYKRHTRLDMNYLCGLAQDLAKSDTLKEQLKYYPNSSIYPIGSQLRYIEYQYKNTRRMHQIVGVDYSEYLGRILSAATDGASIKKLAQTIVEGDITFDDAKEFINEMIDSQLLVNELEPATSGDEFLDQILSILKTKKNTASVIKVLSQTKEKLARIDQNKFGTSIKKYYKIAKELKALDTKYELKFLFQTDMVKPTLKCTLNNQITEDVFKGIEAMNKLTPAHTATNLTQFRDAFRERFEEREMPLVQVLDTEVGIGYLQNQNSGDISPLIDNIALPQRSNTSSDLKWNPIQAFLFQKYTDAISNNKYEIELTPQDLEPFKANWEDLPDTISSMVNIFDDGSIHMKSAGGSSSANLLGRFCHADEDTHQYVKSITSKEKSLNPDVILAEIIHLPESRIGNILLRPVLRDYEIPFLAKSSVRKEFQIPIQDLMISVKQNKILLRSKRLNKEIIPRLSSAHNYSNNALPMYQFLCDMQTQNLRGGVGFNWGALSNEYAFLPRVKFKNIIFSLATWNIKKKEIEELLEAKNDKMLLKAAKNFRKKKNIPKLVLLVESDNELLINLENLLCIKTWLSTAKKKPGVKLTEFLFKADSGITKSREGVFTNQFVISFYKQIQSN